MFASLTRRDAGVRELIEQFVRAEHVRGEIDAALRTGIVMRCVHGL
jgi:hypothetical protein